MVDVDQMVAEGVCGLLFTHTYYRQHEPAQLTLWLLSGDYLAPNFTLQDKGARSVDLQGEITRLGLSATEVRALVRRVIDAMMVDWAVPGRPFVHEMWSAALVAARCYLSDDKDLFRKLLLVTVRYLGGYVRYTEQLVRAICSEDEVGCVRIGSEPDPERLQYVINLLLCEGCTEEEVAAAWKDMLQNRFQFRLVTGLIVPWWRGLRIGKKSVSSLVDVQQDLLLRDFHLILVKGRWDYKSASLGNQDLMWETGLLIETLRATNTQWRRDMEAQGAFSSMFVACLVRGKIGVAAFVFHAYFKEPSLWSSCVREDHSKQFTSLMRAACQEAEKSRRYGIAAALAEQLNDEDAADRLRWFAREYKQPIKLDPYFLLP